MLDEFKWIKIIYDRNIDIKRIILYLNSKASLNI